MLVKKMSRWDTIGTLFGVHSRHVVLKLPNGHRSAQAVRKAMTSASSVPRLQPRRSITLGSGHRHRWHLSTLQGGARVTHRSRGRSSTAETGGQIHSTPRALGMRDHGRLVSMSNVSREHSNGHRSANTCPRPPDFSPCRAGADSPGSTRGLDRPRMDDTISGRSRAVA